MNFKDFKTLFLKKPFIFLYLLPGLGMIGYRVFRPILPIFARRLGASGFEVGLLTSGFMLARGLTAYVIGRTMDASGKRRLFISLGFFFAMLLTFSLSMLNSLTALLLVRFLMGLCAGLIWPTAQVMVVESVPSGFTTRALSIYQISGKAGILVSRAFLSLILLILSGMHIEEIPSFRIVFIIASIVMLLCFWETLLLPAGKREPVKTKEGKPPYSIFFLGFVFGCLMALDSLFYVFINEYYNVKPATIAMLLLALDFLGMFGVYLASHFTDKLGFTRSCWYVIIPTFITAIIIPFAPNLLMVLILYFILRICVSSFIPISRSYASTYNINKGANLGILNMISNLGSVCGPLIAGLMFDRFQDKFQIAGYSILAILLIPAVLFLIPQKEGGDYNK